MFGSRLELSQAAIPLLPSPGSGDTFGPHISGQTLLATHFKSDELNPEHFPSSWQLVLHLIKYREQHKWRMLCWSFRVFCLKVSRETRVKDAPKEKKIVKAFILQANQVLMQRSLVQEDPTYVISLLTAHLTALGERQAFSICSPCLPSSGYGAVPPCASSQGNPHRHPGSILQGRKCEPEDLWARGWIQQMIMRETWHLRFACFVNKIQYLCV